MLLGNALKLLAIFLPAFAIAEPRPLADASKIPDIVQTDPALGLKTIGRSYCGPASVANAIAWLKGDPAADLGDLVRQLASEDYMRTHPDKGTGANGLTRGIERALADLGIEGARLTYHGWRSHPKSTHTGDITATLEHTAAAGQTDAIAWANVGWYRHDAESDTYTRTGGHWVTVVSSGLAADGSPAPDTVAIHDPSPRTGKTTNTQIVKLTPLPAGTLDGKESRLPRPATGVLSMTGAMVIKRNHSHALLDGLLVLHLPEQ